MATITETGYGLQASFERSPEEVDEAIREALAGQGFGILSEIDVQATLKAKLDVDPGTYTIEIKNNGFETARRMVSVSEGGEVTENFELKRK